MSIVSLRSVVPLFCLIIFIAVPASMVTAATIHVPADQPTIQDGINAASGGDTVLVANGLYSGDGNRDLNFNGKNITVKSVGGANHCIIDCGAVTYGTYHQGFVFWSGESEKSVVQGFTIRNGQMLTGSHEDLGGAIVCYNASPRITYNIFTGNRGGMGGAIGCGDGASPTIVGNIITGNQAFYGGGIACGRGSSPHVALNTITHNKAGLWFWGWGGGIFCDSESAASIEGNTIAHNRVTSYDDFPGRGGGVCSFTDTLGEFSQNTIQGNEADIGGGLYLSAEGATLLNNSFLENSAGHGGGIAIEEGGYHRVNSCTFHGNNAGQGGGIYFNGSFHGPSPNDYLLIRNSILWQNEATGDGPEIYAATGYGSIPVDINIQYSDVQGGSASCFLEPNGNLYWGVGMITGNPEFANGPRGDHYLSQIDAGQAVQSPCVDSGDFAGAVVEGTTRTDGLPDTGTADMGWHQLAANHEPDTMISSGPDWDVDSPVVAFTFSGRNQQGSSAGLEYTWKLDAENWSPYSASDEVILSELDPGAHTFSVRARDGSDRIDSSPAVRTFFVEEWEPDEEWVGMVTGPGPGLYNPPLVRTPQNQWLAYGVARHGVNVTCGDFDADSVAEVFTGPGPGPVFGPHVRGFTMSGIPLPGASFFAYGTLKYGVNVAAGDIDGDDREEIITGAGPGAVFGPHVRGFKYKDATITPVPGVSFFAYGTLRWGVNVAAGDIDGDGYDEIITGAGPGPMFGAHVRGWNHDTSGDTLPMPDVNFFAYGTPRYGVTVAAGDIDGDGIDEILTAPGPGPDFAGHVRGWNHDGGSLTPMANVNFIVYGGAYGDRYGARISAGDVDLDGVDEILTMPGPDPDADAYLWSFDVGESDVERIYAHSFQVYNDWMTHGGTVAGVRAD